MRTTNKARASRIISRLRDTWAELAYAQRRVVELRMAFAPLRMPADRSCLDELEALYALPPREPDHGLE